jgi:hypothetical protein
MPVWNLLFSSTLDLGLNGLLASGFVQKAVPAFIYKNAHPCQENFMRRFASDRFLGIVCTGRDARERREAQATIVLISFSPARFFLILFVFICKCPSICFFLFLGGMGFAIMSILRIMTKFSPSAKAQKVK